MVEKILQETATARRLDVLIGSQSITRWTVGWCYEIYWLVVSLYFVCCSIE